MKKFCFITVVILAIMSIHADQTEERAALEKELAAVNQKMHETRLQAIRQDPELAVLRKQIMAMHKEMAIKLDKKPGMRVLADQAEAIREKIKNLNGEKAPGKAGK